MVKTFLVILLLLAALAPSLYGSSGIGLSIGFMQPSLSYYNTLLDSLGASGFEQSRVLGVTVTLQVSERLRLVLGAGRWIYDLPFEQPLSQRMPYQRWTVQLMPLTASFEKGFTLPASIVKPFIGIGAGCCLIGETTYLPDGLSNAEKTSTFLWHVYLGSEVRIFRSMALSVGYRRQFGVYEVVFGGATGTSARVNIGGSTIWLGLHFYLAGER